MWITICQIICLTAPIALVAIVYDLGKETPVVLRYSLLTLAALFVAVCKASWNNKELYEHAAGIAFAGVGVLAVVILGYLIFKNQVQPMVLRIAGSVLGITVLLWAVGSCADTRRQREQIRDAGAPYSSTVAIGDSTKKAIETFNKLTTP